MRIPIPWNVMRDALKARLRPQAGEEAVGDEAAGARSRVEGGKAGQRLARCHARHAPPLQLLWHITPCTQD